MLTDAKMQPMLKIDDEQVKKIETILKGEGMRRSAFTRGDGGVRIWDSATGSSYLSDESYSTTYTALAALHLSYGSSLRWNERGLQKLYDVLNAGQQRHAERLVRRTLRGDVVARIEGEGEVGQVQS